MAYGMQIMDSAGDVYYNSSSEGGVFVEPLALFVIGSSSDRTITYNGTGGRADLKGLELKIINASAGDHLYRAVYNGTTGYPQIIYNEINPTVSPSLRKGTILLVFAR